MIKLKSPLNYRGNIIDAGATVGFLPVEMQQRLIENGAAEVVNQEKQEERPDENLEKPLSEKTKVELLEMAASLGIEGLTDKSTKAEILAAMEEYQKSKE